MKYKLSCADFTFPLLSHEHSLDLISMLGFKGVDIGLFEERSHLWPSREFKNVNRSGRKLKRKLDDHGLQTADVFLHMRRDFRPYAINRPEATRRLKAREWFSKTLNYISELGGRHLSIAPGVYNENESRGDSWSRCVDELKWRVQEAHDYGITLGVEPHVGSIIPRPKSAVKLISDVPGLTFTLDYTHFTRAGLPDSVIEPLVKHASHFHVRGACRGRLQANFDKNTIDYKRVLQVMNSTKFKGWIGIEYVWDTWERCNESDNLSETIKFRDYIKSLMK